MDRNQPSTGVSRRGFLRGIGVAGAGAVILDHPLLHAAETTEPSSPATQPQTGVSGLTTVTLHINGKPRELKIEPRVTLLNAVRDHLEPPITGPKLVCDIGTCGSCTMLVDEKPIYACLMLAMDAIGKKITTVEGLGTPDNMSPVQAAFVKQDAMMCGFCTPGFVTTVTSLLAHNPKPTLEQVREGCKGNFCRCGTYPHIFAAAMEASGQTAQPTPEKGNS